MKRLTIQIGITNKWIQNEEIDNSENPSNSQMVYGMMWNRKGTEKEVQEHTRDILLSKIICVPDMYKEY
jgi:hypothetical protein